MFVTSNVLGSGRYGVTAGARKAYGPVAYDDVSLLSLFILITTAVVVVMPLRTVFTLFQTRNFSLEISTAILIAKCIIQMCPNCPTATQSPLTEWFPDEPFQTESVRHTVVSDSNR